MGILEDILSTNQDILAKVNLFFDQQPKVSIRKASRQTGASPYTINKMRILGDIKTFQHGKMVLVSTREVMDALERGAEGKIWRRGNHLKAG